MFKKGFFVFILAFLFYPAFGFSMPAAPEYGELITQGGELARKGEWNQSELVFLKAAESPIPDERMKAYEGLRELYTKLRLAKKADRVARRMEEEKQFIAKLVPTEDSYYKTYVLAEGDSYAKIAAREKISLEWLKRANQSKPLVTGKSIRVPLLTYSFVVDQKEKTLTWKRGDEIMKIYPVAVGKKETQTPAGEFTIISKVKNPIWYRLKLQIPPESPKNLLGTRWIGLNVKGYGIHGTRNPKSIHYAVSHGCVRMHNHDVEELFEWIPIGAKVTIGEPN